MTTNKQIATAIAETAEVMGTTLSEGAIRLMMSDLTKQASPDDILHAIDRARTEHEGRLTLAAITKRLPNQPMGANEAWELCMKSRIWDEDITIVIPMAAFKAFPFELWREGDKIGSRMAFIEKYNRIVNDHRDEIEVVLGYDVAGRDNAIQDAVRSGLLTADRANAILPHTQDYARLEAKPANRPRITGPREAPYEEDPNDPWVKPGQLRALAAQLRRTMTEH